MASRLSTLHLMISVTPNISLDPSELHFSFIRASGPGGQNVNKVASAVQLRFDAAHSASLPNDVRRRLIEQAGQKANRNGIILIEAKRFRHQTRNREDAVDRLVAMIVRAAKPPTRRRPSKPTRSSIANRLKTKKQKGATKKLRRGPAPED